MDLYNERNKGRKNNRIKYAKIVKCYNKCILNINMFMSNEDRIKYPK